MHSKLHARGHALVALTLLAAAAASQAQTVATGDSRVVRQPMVPPVCMTLTAQYDGSLRATPPATAVDDTASIQNALNACANTGKVVALAASSTGKNAFYSGQLTASGVGIVVRSGVTLYGSNYNKALGALITFTGTNASLMGPGTVDGRGDLVGNTYKNRLIQGSNINNFIIYNVKLTQSIYPNIYVEGGNGLTIWGVTIRTPSDRANADGIDIDSLTNATVTNSSIEAGDDGVAVKTNSNNASNVTVSNNYLYGTHGLSIGSDYANTVSNILFLNNYVDSMDLPTTIGGTGTYTSDSNGARIKTGPCALNINTVSYVNTCVTNSKHLIVVDTQYLSSCTTGTATPGDPVMSNIVINGFYATNSQKNSYSTFRGQAPTDTPLGVYLGNVNVDLNKQQNDQYANVTLFNSNDVPTATGPGVNVTTLTTAPLAGSVPSCNFVVPAN